MAIDWQPIATAPRDGSTVLLYEGYEPDACSGYYDSEQDEWIRGSYTPFWKQPTHWAPLDKPK